MSNTRTKTIVSIEEEILEFNPEFEKLINEINLKEENQYYHLEVPHCDGYKKPLTQKQFASLVSKLEKSGIPYTIYLDPKSDKSLADFKTLHKDTINLIKDKDTDIEPLSDSKGEKIKEEDYSKKKILLIDYWRQSETWKKADERYEAFSTGNKKLVVEKMLSSFAEDYHSTHNEVSIEDAKKHGKLITKDYASWFQEKSKEQSEKLEEQEGQNEVSNNVQRLFLYPHSRPELFENFNKNAGEMNYVENSLPRGKYALVSPKKKSNSNFIPQKSDSPHKKQKTSWGQINSVLVGGVKIDPMDYVTSYAFELAMLGFHPVVAARLSAGMINKMYGYDINNNSSIYINEMETSQEHTSKGQDMGISDQSRHFDDTDNTEIKTPTTNNIKNLINQRNSWSNSNSQRPSTPMPQNNNIQNDNIQRKTQKVI